MDWFPAYAAGLIDGDGCIRIGRHKTGLTIGVFISMTDRRGIDLMQARYGGRTIRIDRSKEGKGNYKPIYMWRVEARKAETLLREVLPYLAVKREQCDLALSVRDHMEAGGILSRGPGHNRSSDKDRDIINFREAAKARMHELNKRGIR